MAVEEDKGEAAGRGPWCLVAALAVATVVWVVLFIFRVQAHQPDVDDYLYAFTARGLRVVARILRDGGFEVVYAGLPQAAEMIAAAASQEDVDVVGVSMHNGAHLTLAPAVVASLRAAGLDTPVIVGGIVPPADIATLHAAGVAAVLGPGASNEEVVASVKAAAAGVATA